MLLYQVSVWYPDFLFVPGKLGIDLFKAFFRIIFDLRSSICDISDAIKQIDRAISRWIELWEKVEAAASPGEIYRAGIMIHAQDLGTLARLLLQLLYRKQETLLETQWLVYMSFSKTHQHNTKTTRCLCKIKTIQG